MDTVDRNQRLDRDRMPYAAALERHTARHSLNLMVPGHGAVPDGGAAELAHLVGDRAVRGDVPPLIDGVDAGPASPLVRAQELAAEAWGAERTWFLTNGASQANRMSAIALAGREPAGKVVMQRSAHSSFVDGILLADLLPVFVSPSIDALRGIHHGVTAADVRAALERAMSDGGRVGAVYIISPSYFGAVADVPAIAEVTRRAGVPLVVDGAWGAHFGFHSDVPESPTRQGADLVVSSTHKMGGSLTQSAMLHLCPGPFASELEPLLDRAFMLTQSTSASALLLGSLDIARHTLQTHTALFEESLQRVSSFRDELRADGRFPLVSDSFEEFPDIVAHDPLRLSIDVRCTGLNGHEVRNRLATEFGVFLEISTAHAVVAFVGPGAAPDLSRFWRALNEISDSAGSSGPRSSRAFPPLPPPGTLRERPRDAFFGRHRVVSAGEAVGRVSADTVSAYPPGIPNVLPGEEITAETVSFLQSVAASPTGYVRGALNAEVSEFRVLED